MILLLATIVLTILLAILLRSFRVDSIDPYWRTATRFAMGIFFCFTGVNHFTAVRVDLINMVPPSFPEPALLVTLSGIAEVVGGLLLFARRFARADAVALILLLIVLFPANIYAAQHGVTVAGAKHPALLPRAVMQLAWIAMLWWSRAARP